jgi:hypothetical protein
MAKRKKDKQIPVYLKFTNIQIPITYLGSRCPSWEFWVRQQKETKQEKLHFSKFLSTILCYFRHVNSMIMLYIHQKVFLLLNFSIPEIYKYSNTSIT